MRYFTFCLLFGLLTFSSGCSGFTDLSIQARNRQVAYKAWKNARWSYWEQGVAHKMREHIGRGFQQGYYDVANGGNGQVPLFPPTYYWGPEYQNPQGNEYVAAWFRGYSDGALAADQAGISGYHSLPTSWAPPYASDPDSPDGGYTPYQAPNSLGSPNSPNNNAPPIEGIPPGRFDNSPILPAPSIPEPKLPLGTPKSVNATVPPGLQREAGALLQPTDATPLDVTVPTLTVPNADIKTEAPATIPAVKPPAAKQTFVPPGSPQAPLTSDAKTIPHVVETPRTGVKK